MVLRLVLFESSISGSPRKVDVEKEFPLLPQPGFIIEHDGDYYLVNDVVLVLGKSPIVVGFPTDNPLE